MLEVEVPHAVLVEHAVGVVHPSPCGCVVIDGAIFFAVGGVERVGELHLLPASEARQLAVVAVGAVDMYVKSQLCVLAKLLEVKGHIIVDMV